MYLVVSLCVVTCCVLGFWHVKQSFSKKYQRRLELQANFTEFAMVNRANQIDQEHVDIFWKSTSESWDYFYNSDVHHLRQSLQDNAHLLISINQELTNCHSGDRKYEELNAEKKQILEWFGGTVELMEPMFEAETIRNPSFNDIGRQCLRIAGRVLRA